MWQSVVVCGKSRPLVDQHLRQSVAVYDIHGATCISDAVFYQEEEEGEEGEKEEEK